MFVHRSECKRVGSLLSHLMMWPIDPHHPFVEAKILACCRETHEQQQQQHQQEDHEITNMWLALVLTSSGFLFYIHFAKLSFIMQCGSRLVAYNFFNLRCTNWPTISYLWISLANQQQMIKNKSTTCWTFLSQGYMILLLLHNIYI